MGKRKKYNSLFKCYVDELKIILLVGKVGVGKTAVAEGLAWKITNNNAPAILSQATVYTLALGSLVAGTHYRGDFERHLKTLPLWLQKKYDTVLFVDGIHSIVGTGNNSDVPDVFQSRYLPAGCVASARQLTHQLCSPCLRQ